MAVLVLIHPFRSLSGAIVDTEQDGDKFNFIFLLGSGISGRTSNSSALYFSRSIHARYIDSLKS